MDYLNSGVVLAWLVVAHVAFMVVPGLMVLSNGWAHRISDSNSFKNVFDFTHSHRHA